MKKFTLFLILLISICANAQRNRRAHSDNHTWVRYHNFWYSIPNLKADTCILRATDYEDNTIPVKIYSKIKYNGKEYKLVGTNFANNNTKGTARLDIPDIKTWCSLWEDQKGPTHIREFARTAKEIWVDGKPLGDTLVIPEGVEYLRCSVFSGFTMSKVILPSSLKYIDFWAFEACENLKEIINLRDDIVVRKDAFAYTNLPIEIIDIWKKPFPRGNIPNKNVWVDDDHFSYEIPDIDADTCILRATAYDDATIPVKIKSEILYNGKKYRLVGADFVNNTRGTKILELPDLKTWCTMWVRGAIDFYGFASTAKEIWVDGKPLGDTLVIPEGVEFIRNNAFYCFPISKVILPSSLKRIDYLAFAWCKRLSEINLGENVIVGENAFGETALPEEIINRAKK